MARGLHRWDAAESHEGRVDADPGAGRFHPVVERARRLRSVRPFLRAGALCRAERARAADPRPPGRAGAGGAGAARPGGRGRALQPGHHLHDLQRRRRDRPHPAVRRHPAPDHGRGLGGDRGRRAPARADAQPVPGRRLRAAEGVQGRADPAGAGAGQRQLPPGDAGPGAAVRHLHPHQRHRPGARRRRAGSGCSRTMAARRRACPTWSRTAT